MYSYILLFIVIFIFYKIKIHSSFALALLIIFSSVRYGIGWDYFSYYGTSNTISEVELDRYGYLWRFLFDLGAKFNNEYLVIWITALLTNLFFYVGIRKIFTNNDRKIYLSIFIYVLYYSFYLSTFSTLRQGLATSLMPLLVYYCTQKEYWKIVIVNIAMIAAHPSAVVVTILWIPFLLFVKRITYKLLIAISIGVVLSLKYLPDIITFLFGPSYDKYLEVQNSFGGKLLYVNILILFFVLSRIKYIKEKQPDLLPYLNLYLVSVVIGLIFRFSQPNDIIVRILKYGDIMLCVILFNLFQFKSRYYDIAKKIILFSLIFLFVAYLSVISGTKGAGGASYIPYKTIFSLRY
jgi:hypothetical protein